MTWLLTGGAGYIGSHIVRAFQAAGTPVVVLDDLSTGFRPFVPPEVPFIEGSVTDPKAVRAALEHGVTGVVHLAGLKYAGVSVEEPLLFYRQNVTGMQVLLEAVVERRIGRFVFSSSSSWYGTPDAELVGEDTPPRPESPYGESKVVSEWLLRDVAAVTPGLAHTSLRYFNVVGSGPPELADHSPHNLFPKVMRALSAGEAPVVFGTDYPTPDGTCVRDYIHVADLADAHLLALESNRPGVHRVLNLGSGEGFSVREVIDVCREVTGHSIPDVVAPRRAGDPAVLVASSEKAMTELGWTPTRTDLHTIVRDAWAFTSALGDRAHSAPR
jgi:UDP-glucose 4-epimerase